MRIVTAAVLLTALALPAAAQEKPLFKPTRDVSVTYRMTSGQGAGGTHEMRMSWLVAEQKLRVDMPGGVGWSLMDEAAQKMSMVLEAQRMVMEMPMRSSSGGPLIPTRPPETARFSRGSTATIAGVPCTNWRYEDGGNRGEACITADGVMLRSQGSYEGHSGSIEATQVTYGPQDAARFRLPQGYQAMQMPGGVPGGAMPGGRPAR
ncbi:hypothetical protein GCM10011504_03090 [Siccirubricoccus deserti]|uniref:DUF4412 domain-containing protein n=1 Tax=Siccirubricoccus deserti TaxID=2013562 RepID=A0A9X0QUT6_9PROT|nr:DUF4412 domain-containing protein [Siccirubricoccus deserti]MBC4014311.1 DUF4412 domain-containing protein [Siccirubricoccus deserti]GGC28271.1 hypothetical protein GCM10011504_03090 [Siccirubricoccus deserti]